MRALLWVAPQVAIQRAGGGKLLATDHTRPSAALGTPADVRMLHPGVQPRDKAHGTPLLRLIKVLRGELEHDAVPIGMVVDGALVAFVA
ncbi:MAG TPA: hypothetical protein VGS80_17720 [Ktedonobacterales bacterium]|nr:hypothetical protein [Ktedonobacterales bacterium]